MSIKYKKIIEEIMGEEAKKRGFTIISHPRLIATKPLGILNRRIDEMSQSIHITEDLIHKGDVYILFEGKKLTYHYDDEESFRQVIHEINDFMLKEGYSKMDEWLEKPYYKQEDILKIKSDFEKTYDEYKLTHVSEGLSDGVKFICTEIENSYDIDWEGAKKTIIYLSELLIGLMLDKIEDTYLKEGRENWIFVERNNNIKRLAHRSPATLVLNAYQHKSTNKYLIEYVKRFLSEAELEEFEENL
ncbi:hypothetical protein [Pseudobutyrivibrio sp.]|jgi:hypothetical protein|uniref:hypothetical protein n=1 Tax=Pseudobutyrivibrio sp. TaxID=2014367 RepID=UPI0025D94840|nr:hypothetical protein [Pseudobutyrivibrio sp.]